MRKRRKRIATRELYGIDCNINQRDQTNEARFSKNGKQNIGVVGNIYLSIVYIQIWQRNLEHLALIGRLQSKRYFEQVI